MVRAPRPCLCKRFGRPDPDGVGSFRAVAGSLLTLRRAGCVEERVEPLWHALGRDPMGEWRKRLDIEV